LAIDVTIPPPPDLPVLPPPGLGLPNPTLITRRAHHSASKKKFNVPHASNINDEQIILLPFTIDHLAGLGSFAHNLLFDNSNPISAVAPHPIWQQSAFRANPAGHTTYERAMQYSPSSLFPKADTAWCQNNFTDFDPFRRYRQPSQWATQALSVNVSTALASHVLRSLRRQETFAATNRQLDLLEGFTFLASPFQLPPPPFLLALSSIPPTAVPDLPWPDEAMLALDI
jgi:hypothetical protein